MNVSNKLIFDGIFKTPDVSTAFTYNVLQGYVLDYSDVILDKVRILISSQDYSDYESLTEICTESITFFSSNVHMISDIPKLKKSFILNCLSGVHIPKSSILNWMSR